MLGIAIWCLLGSGQTGWALDVAWADVDRVLRNRVIRVELRSGEVREGLWNSVEADEFRLDTAQYGRIVVPRGEMRRAWIVKRQVRGRVIGTTLGYTLGAGLGRLSGGAADSPLIPLLAAGTGVLGFLTGRAIDLQREPLLFF